MITRVFFFFYADNDLLAASSNRTGRLQFSIELRSRAAALSTAAHPAVHRHRGGGPAPPVPLRHDTPRSQTSLFQHHPELASPQSHLLRCHGNDIINHNWPAGHTNPTVKLSNLARGPITALNH